jgi:hypothetical protein
MSMALQAFQHKRRLNKAVKDVKNNAPFMGKSTSHTKQESSSWTCGITGKNDEQVNGATKKADGKPQDLQLKSFIPWHNQNTGAGEEDQPPEAQQPVSSKPTAATDPREGKPNGRGSKEKKSPKRKRFFKRRNRHAGDEKEMKKELSQSREAVSNHHDNKRESSKHGKDAKKSQNDDDDDDDDDDWWMDNNDSESDNEGTCNESSHHKKVALSDDDEPEYTPRAEAEYKKSSGDGGSWWE